MNASYEQVCKLVDYELKEANKQFPQFHSKHEGYAVILEEIEEADKDFDFVKYYQGEAWDYIKNNDYELDSIRLMKNHAINAACELIQVAAMCQKYLDMESKHE